MMHQSTANDYKFLIYKEVPFAFFQVDTTKNNAKMASSTNPPAIPITNMSTSFNIVPFDGMNHRTWSGD